MCITQERGEGSLTKKKQDVVYWDGSQLKKVLPVTKKKNKIFGVMCFLINKPYDADLYCWIFYESNCCY